MWICACGECISDLQASCPTCGTTRTQLADFQRLLAKDADDPPTEVTRFQDLTARLPLTETYTESSTPRSSRWKERAGTVGGCALYLVFSVAPILLLIAIFMK